MKHVIIGTAGHVDHGKTTLIQALTGTNPDRLKEEQERGMTIDLGFASIRLPDGTVAGIVDVPGHERFLKNMLAGAGGIDVVLLVIAADESVMPQTREHLDILQLLDVRNGVVALTKVDMVDSDWLGAVEDDIHQQLSETILANAPIIRVAAPSGRGLDSLRKALMSAVSRAVPRDTQRPFRLPIDRVFTRPGFGTVVTGTLSAGSINVGDNVEILPLGITSRVRGLQVHGQKLAIVECGNRVAVNLVGIDTHEISRGAQLAPPGAIHSSRLADVRLTLLQSDAKALADRARVRMYIGTSEVLGRIRILDARDTIQPGDMAYVQFRAESDLVALRGDRFVIRTYSPMRTIGGGVILDTAPLRHRKDDQRTLLALAARESGSPESIVAAVLERQPFGLPVPALLVQTSLSVDDVAAAITQLAERGELVQLKGERVIAAGSLAALEARGLGALEEYHERFPLRSGMPREEFRGMLGSGMDGKAFASLQARWQNKEVVAFEGAIVRLPEFRLTLNERQQALADRIAEYYISCFAATPTVEEVSRYVKAPPDAVMALIRFGLERGDYFRRQDGVYYHTETVTRMKQIVAEYVAVHGSITVGAFRDLVETNRKFALQALEVLDAIHFTNRQGDLRTL